MSSGFITLRTDKFDDGRDGVTVYVQIDKIMYFSECSCASPDGGGTKAKTRIVLDGGGELFVAEAPLEVQEKLAKALERSVVVMDAAPAKAAQEPKPAPVAEPVRWATPTVPFGQCGGCATTWDPSGLGNAYVTTDPSETVITYSSSHGD